MSTARLIVTLIAIPAALVVLFFIGWFCAINSPHAYVLVRNQSGVTVSNVVISGSCERRQAESVTAHREWHTGTRYAKGGHVQLGFLSGAHVYTATVDLDTNHAGACGITFTVFSNMTIKSLMTN
jgi:hypothetical protein